MNVSSARRASHDPDGLLVPLLIGLTVVTGLVDAASYLLLGRVFVANMTGNVVFIGFALAGAQGFSVAASVLALGAFCVGGIGGGRISRADSERGRVLFLGSAIEAGLVALAVLVAAFNPILADAWAGYAVIAVLGIAMGIQNAVVRGLGVRDLTTTVLTLTLTGLAADSVFGGGANAGFSRRTASVVSMFAGALVGTLAVLHVSALVALVLPLIGALLVALVAGVLNRTNPAWSAPARTTSA